MCLKIAKINNGKKKEKIGKGKNTVGRKVAAFAVLLDNY